MPTCKTKPRRIVVEVPEEELRSVPPIVDYPVSREELMILYYDEQKSIREIARELGRGATTVRRWMDIYQIERRGYSQATINHYRKLRGENDDTIED
jgi:predicted transcriptional regulator